jgi:queuine/archaeosine tRNA-ribosyltransferase
MKYYKDTIFFPAVSIATHVSCVKNDYRIDSKPNMSSRFYLKQHQGDDYSFVDHPFILSSAGHNYKCTNYAKEIGINDFKKDVEVVFGDSGGFQIATGAVKNFNDGVVNRIHEWLITNSTLAPIIDHPPYMTGLINRSTELVDSSIQTTKKHIDMLLKRDDVDKIDWLNVVHGTTYNERDYWYQQFKDYDFHSGWALGSLQRNDYVILAAFCSLWDNRVLESDKCQIVHFFGTSSMKFIPTIIYLKYKLAKMGYPVNISFDSSYATKDCSYGKMLIMMPNSSGLTSYHLSNKLIGKFNPDASLPSINPVCKGLRLGDVLNEDALKAASGYQFYNVIQNHNIYTILEYFHKMQSIIFTDCPELWKTGFKVAQLRTFKIIDKMFDAKIGQAHLVLESHQNEFGAINEPDENEDLDNMFQ